MALRRRKKESPRQRLREEVGHVGDGGDERHNELLVLNELTHVEVSALDVLRLVVVLRVVGKVARGLVVGGERRRRARA